MDSDRREWTLVKEKLPLDNTVVLIAYLGETLKDSLFLGYHSEESGWCVNDSEDNPHPWWKSPDLWTSIPSLPKIIEEGDYE